MGNGAALEDAGLAAASRPLDTASGKPVQSSKHLAILYDQAATAMIALGEETHAIAGATKGKAAVPSELKGRARAVEKIEADYGGKPERLIDIARSSVYYDDWADLEAGMAAVRESSVMEVVQEKDRFASPLDGYRDFTFNVRVEGHICEIQLHLTKIIEAKKKGHHDYTIVRGIEARVKMGAPVSADDLATLAELKANMWGLYNDAYADTGGEVTEEQRAMEGK